MKIHNFKELLVWQKAMDIAVYTYQLTGFFPKELSKNENSRFPSFGLAGTPTAASAAASVPTGHFCNCKKSGKSFLDSF